MSNNKMNSADLVGWLAILRNEFSRFSTSLLKEFVAVDPTLVAQGSEFSTLLDSFSQLVSELSSVEQKEDQSPVYRKRWVGYERFLQSLEKVEVLMDAKLFDTRLKQWGRTIKNFICDLIEFLCQDFPIADPGGHISAVSSRGLSEPKNYHAFLGPFFRGPAALKPLATRVVFGALTSASSGEEVAVFPSFPAPYCSS